jgi:glutamate-1-semialdehyde 2,1-aminomutase
MTKALAAVFEHPDPDDPHAEIATGGTLFANAVSMAAGRAALGQVLTPDVYERTGALGARLADGIETVAQEAGLPWCAHRLFPRSGYAHGGQMPQNAEEARGGFRRDVTDLQRVYFANRGVWEAIYSAGPCVGIAHTEADVDQYLAVLAEFASELVA